MDDILYNNCPVFYLPNMPADHPYMQMYNERQILIVVGRGRWEEPLIESTDRLNHVLRSKGINATIDYWGHDVDHDWPWWFKMVEHYLPHLLG
jgi:esterase/lipase superfamily enzyme